MLFNHIILIIINLLKFYNFEWSRRVNGRWFGEVVLAYREVPKTYGQQDTVMKVK